MFCPRASGGDQRWGQLDSPSDLRTGSGGMGLVSSTMFPGVFTAAVVGDGCR